MPRSQNSVSKAGASSPLRLGAKVAQHLLQLVDPLPGVLGLKLLLGPRQRPDQPLALDRLQQIIGDRAVERLRGILVEGGDEDHQRRIGPLGDRLDHLEAVAVAHLDVEQDDVGAKLVDLGQRLGAAAGLADMLGLGNGLKQQLQALAAPAARRRSVRTSKRAS